LSEAKSAITDGFYPDKILIRGYRINDLIEHSTFPDVAFLTIFGKLPTKEESVMTNAMLVACVDHGLAPSALASRIVIGGAPEALQGAVAAGILAMGDRHGGAGEMCAKMLQDGVKRAKKEGKSLEEMAEIIVHEYWVGGKVIEGIGHPFHKVDPRVGVLFGIAEKEGFKKENVKLLENVQVSAERAFGRKLPINVDGAIGAIISDMGMDHRMAKAFFIMSRVVGLVSHTLEEMKRPAMDVVRNTARKIPYDGPPENQLR
jgi:citrate synthase